MFSECLTQELVPLALEAELAHDDFCLLEMTRSPYLFEYFLNTLDVGCGVRRILGHAKLIVRGAHCAAVIAYLESGPSLLYQDGAKVGPLKQRHVVIHAGLVEDYKQRLRRKIPSKHSIRVRRHATFSIC